MRDPPIFKVGDRVRVSSPYFWTGAVGTVIRVDAHPTTPKWDCFTVHVRNTGITTMIDTKSLEPLSVLEEMAEAMGKPQ